MSWHHGNPSKNINLGIVLCESIPNKQSDCSDVKFPIDTTPSNYEASKARAYAAAQAAANGRNHYETSWWHGGGSICTGVAAKKDCNYFGVFGDCWPVEYHLTPGPSCE
jgi:hypothetical protein